MITAVLFAAAAAGGALLRAAAGQRWNRPEGMPYGILMVNIAGSFLLGVLSDVAGPTWTVLGVGGLGTFTTFSSFARDIVALTERDQLLLALAYLMVSCVGGVGAAALGVALVT